MDLGLRAALFAGAALAFATGNADAQNTFNCVRKGGNFVFGQEAKANSLDQHTSSTISTRNVAMNMFESLMTRDENMSPIPELASEVIESADKKTYTFKLRQGIKFHNGKTMTSADVMASYQRYVGKKEGNAWAGGVGIDRGIYAVVDAFEAPDPATFVVRLKEPQPTFLENFSSFSVPVVIVPAEITSAPAMQMPTIGTGPFQLVEFVADAHVRMRRFDGYTSDGRYKDTDGFGGNKVACLDTVTVRFVVEQGARVAGLETGELHAVEDLPAKAQERLKTNSNIVLRPLKNFWVQIATPNFTLPPMDNLNVRRAIQAALDMDEIMDAATDGAYALNVGFQYPGQAYYTDAGKELYNQKNAAKAKQLLQQAGYRNEEVVLLTNRDYPSMYNAAVVMAEQLKAVGINARLAIHDWPATVNMQQNTTTGWHWFFTGYGTNTSLGGIAALRFHAPPFNTYKPKAGEEDKEFVAAFNDIANGDTLDKRKAAFARAQARIFDQVMALPFGSLTKVQATRANVEGFKPYRIPRFSNVSLKN
jgi:peptide/nickel transport system substrate-binding protein